MGEKESGKTAEQAKEEDRKAYAKKLEDKIRELQKAGKNTLKMTGVSRTTFIGRICGEKKPPFVVFFFHCKQNHMEYLQFQKEYLILFPVSVEIQMLPACSRFAAFLLRWDCQTPGLSNSRFCTFEGAPVLLFPCHRDSDPPLGRGKE